MKTWLLGQLIVVISLDQVPTEYLDRFAPYFTSRGFNRLQSGAVFPNSRLAHAGTATAPGHATIGSGLVPAEHGIIANKWFERDAPFDEEQWEFYFEDITPFRRVSGKALPPIPHEQQWWRQGGSPRYSAYDEHVEVTAGKEPGMSPISVTGESLGERIKSKYPNARVVSVTHKERSAVMMGGRAADAVYWREQPGFITSTYYPINPKILEFNAILPGYIPGSQQWKLSPYIPPADMERITFDPPAAWPLKNTRYGGTFPHSAKDGRGTVYAPFGHELLLDFALHVLETEKLGRREGTPDLFFVGVSSTDYLGHYYGPDSMEVADSMVRLDRALGHFLDALERRFGASLTVVLTADHGISPNPEIAKLKNPNADVGRTDFRSPDANATVIADLPPLRVELERRLARAFELPFSETAPLRDALVDMFESSGMYLNWRRIAELKLDGERVKRELRDILLSMKQQHGIAGVWTNTELTNPRADASETERLMRNSFRADRSGDILIALRPGWQWYWGSNSTTHGQPIESDRRVPLIFWGAGIVPGRYEVEASPADIAPTLGALLGVKAGGRAARVLPCVRYPSPTP